MAERVIHHNIVNDAMKEIDALQRELNTDTIEDTRASFYSFIRRFFNEFFNISYEFSADDVADELRESHALTQSQRERLIQLLTEYEEQEYSPELVEVDTLHDLMQKFRQLIFEIMQGSMNERLSYDSQLHLHLYRVYRWYHRLLESFFSNDPFLREYHTVLEYLFLGEVGIAREEVSRLSRKYGEDKEGIRRLSRKVVQAEIDTLLKEMDEGFSVLDSLLKGGNLEGAKNQFLEIKRIYSGLGTREKRSRYADLVRLYKRLYTLSALEGVRAIQEKVSAAWAAFKDDDADMAEKKYFEVETMFTHLPSWAQKKVRKGIHELGITLYSS